MCSQLSRLCVVATLMVMGLGRVGDAAEPAPIPIAAIYNLSGAQASLDRPSLKGAQLAVEEANKRGGVLGRKLRLIVKDGKSKPEIIAKETRALLRRTPSIAAFMGLSDTDMVLAAAPLAAKSGRLFLTSGATSPRLTSQVPKFLFLACFGDNVQAAAAAEWAYVQRAARTVSVLFDASMSYTRLLHTYFQARFTELGGRVLSVRSYYPVRVEKAVEGLQKSDVIFVAAGPDDAAKIVRLLRKSGHSAPILGGDGFDSEEAWRDYPEARSVFFTTHAYLGSDNPNPRIQAFRESYLKSYRGSVPDAFSALGYDAARLIINAIGRADSTAPAKVVSAFSRIRSFEGVSGSISYLPGSRIPSKSVTIIEIANGKRKLAGTLVPRKVPRP